MKSFLALVAVGVLCLAAWLGYQRSGPSARARAAYEHHATAILYGRSTAGKAALARFGAAGQAGDIQSVEYELESQREEDGVVEIVAIQHVTRVFRDSFGNPAGRPQVSQARHRATVERSGEAWQVTELESERLP